MTLRRHEARSSGTTDVGTTAHISGVVVRLAGDQGLGQDDSSRWRGKPAVTTSAASLAGVAQIARAVESEHGGVQHVGLSEAGRLSAETCLEEHSDRVPYPLGRCVAILRAIHVTWVKPACVVHPTEFQDCFDWVWPSNVKTNANHVRKVVRRRVTEDGVSDSVPVEVVGLESLSRMNHGRPVVRVHAATDWIQVKRQQMSVPRIGGGSLRAEIDELLEDLLHRHVGLLSFARADGLHRNDSPLAMGHP